MRDHHRIWHRLRTRGSHEFPCLIREQPRLTSEGLGARDDEAAARQAVRDRTTADLTVVRCCQDPTQEHRDRWARSGGLAYVLHSLHATERLCHHALPYHVPIDTYLLLLHELGNIQLAVVRSPGPCGAPPTRVLPQHSYKVWLVDTNTLVGIRLVLALVFLSSLGSRCGSGS